MTPLLCGVAKEIGVGGRFRELERGQEGRVGAGVEGAVEEEVFSGFRLAAACANQPIGLEVRLAGTRVASAGS